GFVLGEGAGVIVLESAEHAAARGARVYAEAVGQGISADSHDIVQPEPEGRGIAHALQNLLENTDLDPAEIVHVNAHATSTPASRPPAPRVTWRTPGRCARCPATRPTPSPSPPPSP